MIAELPWLLLWGTVVGLDLISWPQTMIARPLVSGIVAGWIVGDVAAGAVVGAVFELFALELLPVGAARYPDYGTAAVAATAAASGAPDVFGVGPGVLMGLAVGYLGQESIHVARRRTAVHVRAEAAVLDAGDPGAIRRVHFHGLGRDALRALIVTAVGLLGALVLRTMPPIGVRAPALLQLVALGAAIGVASLGAARVAGAGVGRVWLAAGLTLGLVWVILR